MKQILLLFLLFISFKSHGFYLISNYSLGFGSKNVNIYVTSNSTCTNAGVTAAELLEISVEAAQKFWNKVPTSSLVLERGGLLQTSDSKFLNGKLCAYTGAGSCDATVDINEVSNIVIACNDNTIDNFKSPSAIFAVSLPNSFNGTEIKGSVILVNNTTLSPFAGLDRSGKINVIAHELGHAIGLGHTDTTSALMYPTNISERNRLGQDDIDGLTYLYPNKIDSCNSFLGSIALQGDNNDKDDSNPPWQSFIIGLGLCLILWKGKLIVKTL